MATYSVHSRNSWGKRLWYVTEDRNPHISQHNGYYITRSKAIAAMRRLLWGETPPEGDVTD